MKRASDIILALIGLAALLPMGVFIALAIRNDSPGPAIFWSKRFGKDGAIFAMPKFRTMRTDTPQLPTHLLADGSAHLTRLGGFLRRTSIDELPQLWSVLVGDMSLVGPRPALFNQHDLMALRRAHGVDGLRPGITGWAQVNGRDDLDLSQKVRYETDYLARQSLSFDLKILVLTLMRMLDRRGIAH